MSRWNCHRIHVTTTLKMYRDDSSHGDNIPAKRFQLLRDADLLPRHSTQL
jgi:hypothetical protein